MFTVYSKPSCVQCDATKRYLEKHGLPFEVIDVSVDTEAYDRIVGWGFRQVPVVENSTGDRWSGFQPSLLSI